MGVAPQNQVTARDSSLVPGGGSQKTCVLDLNPTQPPWSPTFLWLASFNLIALEKIFLKLGPFLLPPVSSSR